MTIAKHPRKGSRTQKDEVEYDAELREQESIKSAVIKELKDASKFLFKERKELLASLIYTTEMLINSLTVANIYRKNKSLAIENIEEFKSENFEWDTVNGWKRKER